MSQRVAFTTDCEASTEAAGAALAAQLAGGTVVALHGELAAGKTCFVRGVTAQLAPGADVHSPTFTLINEYGQQPRVLHIDLYRLSGPAEVADLGYLDLIDDRTVCLIEWGERAGPLLPPARVDVWFTHAGGDRRRVVIEDRGVLPSGWHSVFEQHFATT